ncbi:hypothetical protein [Streptomyces sp. NPDC058291]
MPASAAGVGLAVRGRRAPAAVTLPTVAGELTGREALGTAA